jgi:hypothetical protein
LGGGAARQAQLQVIYTLPSPGLLLEQTRVGGAASGKHQLKDLAGEWVKRNECFLIASARDRGRERCLGWPHVYLPQMEPIELLIHIDQRLFSRGEGRKTEHFSVANWTAGGRWLM